MDAKDLYALPIGDSRALCGGNSDDSGNEESCVTIAPVHGAPGAVALGDSKDPSRAPLRFDATEMRNFVTAYAQEHGITL